MALEQDAFDFEEFDLVPITVTPDGVELLAAPEMIYPLELGFPASMTPVATTQEVATGNAEEINPQDLTTQQKVDRAIAAITRLITDGRPLSVSYSGGKDSSVMAALVLEAARRVKEAAGDIPPLLFTHSRTGIDNPAMDMVARMEIERIREYAKAQGLPVRVDIAEPALNDSWAVRIISGRALPTFANSSSRDCAISWKLIPQQRQRKAAFKELQASGKPVTLVGTRFDESSGRNARMTARGEMDTEVWEDEVRSADGKLVRTEHRLSPIAHWTQEDIWVFLSELSSGQRVSYTNAKDLWDVYRDGGNSSCAVVADDTMKANAKACGARFGCSLCTAVGRDKSLEAMLEADPKYQYLVPLNTLQRFLVDTQYDSNRRGWLGRTISDDGYIAITPDTYSPQMQRDLLSYALTIDRDEKDAARKAGIAPRFQLVNEKQLLAIDAIWSIQGYHPRPFEAIHIWEAVYERGESFRPPEVDPSSFVKKFPKPQWLHVGNWEDAGYNTMYTGARHLMADFTGATEAGGCMHNMELGDGRVVMAIETSDMFDVDQEGADLFLAFEVLDSQVHHRFAQYDPGEAFRHYQLLGTLSTSKRHVGMIDDMLRRSAWKQRNGVFDMNVDELLSRSVTDAQRKEGLLCPPGQTTLSEDLAARLDAMHEAREKTGFERMRAGA